MPDRGRRHGRLCRGRRGAAGRSRRERADEPPVTPQDTAAGQLHHHIAAVTESDDSAELLPAARVGMLHGDRGAEQGRRERPAVSVVLGLRGVVNTLGAGIALVRRALPFRGERTVMRGDGRAERPAEQHLSWRAAVGPQSVTDFEETTGEVV